MLRIGSEIARRLDELGATAMAMARALPNEPAFKHIGPQLARAATSAGANYEEARGAESRADFIHKVSVAAKEMREAVYWIRLVRAIGSCVPEVADRALNEATQLAAILSASARTARHNARNGDG